MSRVLSVLFVLVCTVLSGAALASPRGDAVERLRALAPEAELNWREDGRALESIFGLRFASVGKHEQTGRAFLDEYAAAFGAGATSELRLAQAFTTASGLSILRYQQWLEQVPVYQSQIVVWVDLRGDLVAALGVLAADSGKHSAKPSVDALSAIQRLRDARMPMADVDPSELQRRSHLLWRQRGGELRLVYLFDVPELHQLDGRLATLDAQTGELLMVEELVYHEARVNAFLPSPGPLADRPTQEVQLWQLDDSGKLSGPLIKAQNCVNQGQTITVYGMAILICSEVHKAQADVNGDFLFEPVWSDNQTVDPATGELLKNVDDFAESHMYYHMGLAYQFFQALGLTQLSQTPIRAVVNFRIPDMNNPFAGTLVPFDNAAFMPAGPLIPGVYERADDSMVFGQGTWVDFSYDGDIVYHEFTHGVIFSTSNLGQFSYDQQGLDSAPGALHEAFADYFAATITDDPAVGDHVGTALGVSSGAIRNLTEPHACPDNQVAEVHDDSTHFSGALWDLRSRLVAEHGAELATIDQAIFDAMVSLNPMASHRAASQAVRGRLWLLSEAWLLTVDEVFAQRNVADCQRVIELDQGERPVLYVYGPQTMGMTPSVPSIVQFKVTVPEGSNTVRIDWLNPAEDSMFSTRPKLEVVGKAGSALGFGYAPASGRLAVSHDGSLVSGERSTSMDNYTSPRGEAVRAMRFEASFGGLEPGDYYFSLLTTAGQGALYRIRAFVDEVPVEVVEEPVELVEVVEEPVEPVEPVDQTPADNEPEFTEVLEAVPDQGEDELDEQSPDQLAESELEPSEEKASKDGCGCRLAAPQSSSSRGLWLGLSSVASILLLRRRAQSRSKAA